MQPQPRPQCQRTKSRRKNITHTPHNNHQQPHISPLNLLLNLPASPSPNPHLSLTYSSHPPNSSLTISSAASIFSLFELTIFLTPTSSPSRTGLASKRVTKSSRRGASPWSVRAYSSAMASSSTPARERSRAASRPVRSLPAVQWKTQLGGSPPSFPPCPSSSWVSALKHRKIVPNASPAWFNISRYAATKPSLPERV